jgi:hypothetical protein
MIVYELAIEESGDVSAMQCQSTTLANPCGEVAEAAAAEENNIEAAMSDAENSFNAHGGLLFRSPVR